MRRITFVGLMTLLFQTVMLYAQETVSMSGSISDASDGETLLGATILVDGTGMGTVTNEYGFYSLTMPKGKYTIVVSYIGYDSFSKEIDLQTDQKMDFELEASSTELTEVVLTADETKKVDIKKPEMSTVKIKASAIKKIPAVLGELDVIKSIQLMPGVTNNGEGSGGFNVRGGAADQNLVLLDEAIIYNSSHLLGFFSVFNADAVKDLKLYKGGIPAQFGGRVSSVLDIRQRDGNSKAYKLTGGIGFISSRAAIEGPAYNGKGSFLLAGRSSYAHLFLDKNSASFYDVNLKTNYKMNDKNKLFLSAYLGNDGTVFGSAFNNTYGNISGNLRWNHIFTDKLFSNLSLIYTRYYYNMKLNAAGLEWKSNIENYHVKYDLTHYFSDKIKLTYGVSGIQYNFNPGEITPYGANSTVNYQKLDDKKAFETGAYVSAEHKISLRLTASYGLRYSNFFRVGPQPVALYKDGLPVVYNELLGIYERGERIGEQSYTSGSTIKTFGNIEPRLALSFQLTDESSLKASYNRMTQYLHLISNTSSVTPLDVWTPSGEFVDPQIADQFAIGYFRNITNGAYSLELETYYKTVANRVDYIDGSDLIAQNNIETEILSGESRAYGLELLLRKNTGRLTGWLAYTLSRAEQRTLGGASGGPGINGGDWYYTNYDRTHDISLTASYKLSDKWRMSANFIFQTGRPVSYPNGQFEYLGLSVPSYSKRNEDRLPAYHRLDISATYIPNKSPNKRWKGEWVFGIYNIYNRKNAASISFAQNGDTGRNEATKTYIFGIMPAVSYNFKF